MTEQTAIVATRPQKPAVGVGGSISAMVPQDLDQAFRMATAIAQSGMAPKAYGGDVNKVFAGILAGMEVGFAPFQALQSIAVINGNPSIWGDGALGLVRASGLLVDFEETDDGETATCRAVRAGQETQIIRTFSNEDAKKAGLLGKQGPWTQYQARMRQMRARSFTLRDGFADVLKGLHIAEEVRDYPVTANDAPPTHRLTSDMLIEQASHTEVVTPAITDASQEQASEITTLESALSEVASAGTVVDVNSRVTALMPLFGEEDASTLRSAAMDRIAALKGAQ